jgi:hypothetical protein
MMDSPSAAKAAIEQIMHTKNMTLLNLSKRLICMLTVPAYSVWVLGLLKEKATQR